MRKFAIVFVLALCWFAWALLNAHWRRDNPLVPYYGNVVLCQGYIRSIPEVSGHRIAFRYCLTSPHKACINLSWYNHRQVLQVGERWQFLIKLKANHGFANPGGFNYEQWLLLNHIAAHGYIKNDRRNKRLARHSWRMAIGWLRQIVNTKLASALHGNQFTGLLQALVVGSRAKVTPSQWRVFKNTGTSHLMAISGLHVGLVASWIFFLVHFLWTRSRWLCLRMAAVRVAAIAGLLAALAYSLLAGLSLPTQRALIMIAVYMSDIVFRRHTARGISIFRALILMICYEPLAVLSDGFWLSFMAVSMLFYGLNGRLGKQRWWQDWSRAQWVASCGMIPLSLLFFGQVSLHAPLANVIAIPWIGMVVVPLCLIATVLLFIIPHFGVLVIHFAAIALGWIWPILTFLSQQQFWQWQYAINASWQFIALLIATLLWLAPKGFPAKIMAILLLLTVLLNKPVLVKNQQLRLTLLDVGQGLSAVLQTRHHVLVYDTGPRFSQRFDLGKMVVIPFLQYYHIKTIDMMMISHGDNDHIGGAAAILDQLPVDTILTSVPWRFKIANRHYCYAGQQWQWDGVGFQVLSPPFRQEYQVNNSSCVLQVTVGQHKILLTGDIEKPAEDWLVSHYGKTLQSDIIIVPHHGSKTSSTTNFVAMVKPRYALFPLGFANRFHFPAKSVWQRYLNIGAIAETTAAAGAMTILIKPTSLGRIIDYRDAGV